MRSGKLDRKIILQSFTEVRDAVGGVSETPNTFATVWAQVKDISASEKHTSNQDLAQKLVSFKIRYLAGLTPKMKILYNDDTYDIQGISEVGRKEGLHITALLRGA